jgi:FkbM family methyltransferase
LPSNRVFPEDVKPKLFVQTLENNDKATESEPAEHLNSVTAQFRLAARRFLPQGLRRPLGTLVGKLDKFLVRPAQGLLFDLKGGRFHTDGCTFTVPKDVTSRSYRSCFLRGDYEQDERDLIRRWIQPDDRVLELGACLGIVSCVTNKLLLDKSAHVVVEANPFCIATLYRNKEINGSGFLIEHCAVGNQPEVIFYLHPVYIVGGTAQRPSNRPVRLPAKSLARLERERGPFTALIIDIEGGEGEVFEASVDLLKRYRLVVAELHDWAIGAGGVERCRQVLRESGLEFAGRAGITEAWRRP